MPSKAQDDLFLTLDRTRVVPGGHPKAKFLLARKGAEILDKVAARHGIVDGKLPEESPAIPDISTPRANILADPKPARASHK